MQLGYATAAQVSALKQPAYGSSLKVYAWNVVGPYSSKLKYDALGADGLLVQVEGKYQYDGAISALDEGIASGQPKGCVTTYAGLENGQWAELAKRGVTDCHVECYRSDGVGHADLDRMLAQGVVYGIPLKDLYAVCGTYKGESPAMYGGLDKLGRSYACYLGEPMTPEAWKAWGGVNMTTPVYWWVLSTGPVSSPTILHQERAITYPDKSTGLGKMTAWMGAHLDTIRAAHSVDLDRILK